MNTIADFISRITTPDTCAMLDSPDINLAMDDARGTVEILTDTARTIAAMQGRTTKARKVRRREKANAATLPRMIETGCKLRKAVRQWQA